MSNRLLLTFNAGSSTLKIGFFRLENGAVCRGTMVIDLAQCPVTFSLKKETERHDGKFKTVPTDDMADLVTELFQTLSRHYDLSAVTAVGHRVVHGGDRYDGPVRIGVASLAAVEALVPLAPLHQPQSLRFIRAVGDHLPDIPQTASFDTSFHITNEPLVRRLALPQAIHDRGIKRYGFHGLSYAFIARELRKISPEAKGRKVIVAHLGSGCSLCGIIDGVSKDTSMGFSTLDGVPMATRCGALDPGVLLHLLANGYAAEKLEELLYHRSGLLGVSGISGDVRELVASDKPDAREALDLFMFRIAGEACRIANTLGGLDILVFTAGIGEHQPTIRAAIASHLGWLGLSLDPVANAVGATTLSMPASRIKVFLIPTDEEQVIAEDAVSLLFATDDPKNVDTSP